MAIKPVKFIYPHCTIIKKNWTFLRFNSFSSLLIAIVLYSTLLSIAFHHHRPLIHSSAGQYLPLSYSLLLPIMPYCIKTSSKTFSYFVISMFRRFIISDSWFFKSYIPCFINIFHTYSQNDSICKYIKQYFFTFDNKYCLEG